MTKISEHDFTNPRWGHNIDILNWDTDAHVGRAVCWTTPPLKDGDIIIVKSKQGSMRLEVSNVERCHGVNDMYRFDILPEREPMTIEQTEELWVVKVRRNGGGSSIIDVEMSKEKAQALTDEFNGQYQTDNYFIEPYDEKIHAYDRDR